jgi:hypothetical protein
LHQENVPRFLSFAHLHEPGDRGTVNGAGITLLFRG